MEKKILRWGVMGVEEEVIKLCAVNNDVDVNGDGYTHIDSDVCPTVRFFESVSCFF
jgi:hypothetical protein